MKRHSFRPRRSYLEDLLAREAVSAQKLLPDSQDGPARILNIAGKAMENL
jgi:hypothetical protein